MQRGVSTWEASRFLGMTPEALERVYGDHSQDFMRAVAKALS
jgi:hypothetical protein